MVGHSQKEFRKDFLMQSIFTVFIKILTQLKFTCSKSTIETLKKVLLLLPLNIFHTFSKVSLVDSEQVNISWESNPCTLLLSIPISGKDL